MDQENIPGLGQVLADTAVSTLVTSLNGVPIVVESAMYWHANGIIWAAGTNAPATRLPYP